MEDDYSVTSAGVESLPSQSGRSSVCDCYTAERENRKETLEFLSVYETYGIEPSYVCEVYPLRAHFRWQFGEDENR